MYWIVLVSLSGIKLIPNLEGKIPAKYEKPRSSGRTSAKERFWIVTLLPCEVDEVHAEMQGGEILPEKTCAEGNIVWWWFEAQCVDIKDS